MKIWKYRGTWALEMSRHTPAVLGTSGALGVGWDTPRSIKIGHAHVLIENRGGISTINADATGMCFIIYNVLYTICDTRFPTLL
jgi:hypothetical protein